MLRAAAFVPPVAARTDQPPLGGDHELPRIGLQSLGDELLGDVGPIAVGGIEEGVPQIERTFQQLEHGRAIPGPAPDIRAGHAHRPESQPVHGQIADGALSATGPSGGWISIRYSRRPASLAEYIAAMTPRSGRLPGWVLESATLHWQPHQGDPGAARWC